jgi:hypothetical protein
MTADKRTVKDIAIELEATMQCVCDLDNWEPDKSTGHSRVCPIHKKAEALKRESEGLSPVTPRSP